MLVWDIKAVNSDINTVKVGHYFVNRRDVRARVVAFVFFSHFRQQLLALNGGYAPATFRRWRGVEIIW